MRTFETVYEGMKPNLEAITPGRVNIIGEHVDHQKYSVLPCCIENTIRIQVYYAPKKSDCCPALELEHVNPARFESRKFQDVKEVKVSEERHWTNYIVAAYLGLMEYCSIGNADKVGMNIEPKKGMTEELIKTAIDNAANDGKLRCKLRCPATHTFRMLVDGDVPEGAGLSSSSALVICAAQALDSCVGDMNLLARICTQAERYVGMAGGGMDQAAVCLCQEGAASHIKFFPLETSNVQLPSEVALVIANTCREAPKVRDAAKMYNMRVFELKMGCLKILASTNGGKAPEMELQTLLELGLRDICRDHLKLTEKEMLEQLPKLLPNEPLGKAEVDSIMGEKLRDQLLDRRCGRGVWDQNDLFYPYQRIKHVLAEAIRVQEFVDTCLEHVKPGKPTDLKIIEKLGKLLDESHFSLDRDFGCSCDELNEITQLARTAPGCYGSRLTGAGWGGCTVSLVDATKTKEFIDTVTKGYFIPRMKAQETAKNPLEFLPKTEAELPTVIFATKPSAPTRTRKL